jgi:hypothetical protein
MARCGLFSAMTLSVLGVTLMVSPSIAQTAAKSKSVAAPKPVDPTRICPDPDAAVACKSFRQLLDAHDTGILDSIKPSAYVCFRPKSDVFFIFQYAKPISWSEADSDGIRTAAGRFSFTEYRNGLASNGRYGPGTWRQGPAVSETGPAVVGFESSSSSPLNKGLNVSMDSDEIGVQFDLPTTNNETVKHAVSIRRSTGRFAETFKLQEKPLTEDVGACLVFK